MIHRFRGKLPFLAAAMLCLPASGAWAAAGTNVLSSHGVEASARGLAFTAKADSYEAFYHNPAGLARIQGHHIGFSLMSNTTRMKIDREDALLRPNLDAEGRPTGGGTPLIGEGGQPLMPEHRADASSNYTPPPLLGYIYGMENVPLAFGIGLTSPNADNTRNWGSRSANRYMLVKNELINFTIEAGIAYSFGDRIHLGATFGNTYVEQINDLQASMDLQGKEDPAWDAPIHFEAVDIFTPSWMVGLLADVTDSVTLGYSYRGASSAEVEGDGSFTPAQQPLVTNLIGGEKISFDMNMPVNLPDIHRVGLRIHQPEWDVELDYIRSNWSRFGDINIHLKNLAPDASLTDAQKEQIFGLAEDLTAEPLSIRKDYKDADAFGLGGSIKPSEALTVRAGFHFQEGALPNQDLDGLFIDLDTYMFGAGATYALTDGLALSGAYSYVWSDRVTVTDSRRTSINLASELLGQDLSTVIGNGTYSQSANQFLVGAVYNF